MKKTFPLKVPGKADARVFEAIIGDVRKYVKRERRKKVTEGVDFWDFDCKVGRDQETPAVVHIKELINAIDAVAKNEEATAVYVEIIAKPGVRMIRPVIEPQAVETPVAD